MSARPQRPVYFSNGEALQTPPMTVRVRRFVESVYYFLGLYFTSLLSIDAYTAAENSSFNVNNPNYRYQNRSRWGNNISPQGGGGRGGGGGGDGPGFGPRRVGRVDDVRGPELDNLPIMSAIPATDAEWAEKIAKMKEHLPEHTLSQPPIPIPTRVNRTIDHTLLTTPIDASQIDTLCKEALEHDFAAVCVRLEHVPRAVAHVKGSNTAVACVVAFPEGTHETAEKVREAKEAVAQGAQELDMVIRYGLLKEGRYTEVYEDVLAVRKAAPAPIILKTILEASMLTKDELLDATIVSCMAGADYIKTSTGWNGGASLQHIALMRIAAEISGSTCKIKASGGLRNADDVVRMLKAGAHRIGTSSGIKIMREVDEGEVLEQGVGHAAY
ncbi:hypothetical protein N7457_005653 [Penicillium paradoxum]|uniref:uncharacterized protein n=1 Tax=Penicillium paradoxum TaxID=176176 RepID=UPI002547B004|nr:uncharacterized protein N7457_005653 [Penicillium paradoxum]KAJ5780493.1 hypothetical protein N7457_005653 [Penicillium paradoxum]